jgi:hypothetical protein
LPIRLRREKRDNSLWSGFKSGMASFFVLGGLLIRGTT